jgi:hypothetical protein
MNIDLGKIVSMIGAESVAQIGEPLGLDKELSMKAAKALAENFTGDKDEAVKAAAAETGIGQEVLMAMFGKLVDEGKGMAIDAAKEQASGLAKGLMGKFFGR